MRKCRDILDINRGIPAGSNNLPFYISLTTKAFDSVRELGLTIMGETAHLRGRVDYFVGLLNTARSHEKSDRALEFSASSLKNSNSSLKNSNRALVLSSISILIAILGLVLRSSPNEDINNTLGALNNTSKSLAEWLDKHKSDPSSKTLTDIQTELNAVKQSLGGGIKIAKMPDDTQKLMEDLDSDIRRLLNPEHPPKSNEQSPTVEPINPVDIKQLLSDVKALRVAFEKQKPPIVNAPEPVINARGLFYRIDRSKPQKKN